MGKYESQIWHHGKMITMDFRYTNLHQIKPKLTLRNDFSFFFLQYLAFQITEWARYDKKQNSFVSSFYID